MHLPVDDVVALQKEAVLTGWLLGRGSLLVGYSGGVDSAYLAVVARAVLGRDRVLAVLGRSAAVPLEQIEAAVRFAGRHDLPLRVVDTDELADPRYASNPANRCYFCKSVLWDTLAPLARTAGLAAVADGTNADDVGDYRPGGRAAAERGVATPLADAGLTKPEIRWLSRRRGFETWAQPSAPCLASRIPYGTPVTAERLDRVGRGERALRALGIAGDVRVRHHGDLARVELEPSLMASWLSDDNWPRLADALRDAGFTRVAIDLRGFRSGSLNVLEGIVRE